jgi:uncharacterized protein YbaP (TraB family)
MDYAREHGRPLQYLENIREQMKLLTTGDDASQLKALKNLIVTLPRSRDPGKGNCSKAGQAAMPKA